MSKLTILALGSRGDVQPFIALSLGLQAAGIEATIAAAADYGDLVEAYGVPFQPLVGAVGDIVDPYALGTALHGKFAQIQVIRHFFGRVRGLLTRLMADASAACAGSDGLIVASLGVPLAPHLAERHRLPWIAAHMHPSAPTAQSPAAFMPALPRQMPGVGIYNRLSHRIADQVRLLGLARALNRARAVALGLPPLSLHRLLQPRPVEHLHAYSALIEPAPSDWSRPPLGYWMLPPPPDWAPSAELAAFLAAGPPPILFSFGSIMLGEHGRRLTAMISAACAQHRVRAIIGRGWGDLGLGELAESILAIDSVPHTWLMPHCAAVVHHGGAGVTATAMHSGIPALCVPFLGDQPYWGERIHALGVGPKPIPHSQLGLPSLIEALGDLQTPRYRWAAQKLAVALCAEDGIAKGVAAIIEWLSSKERLAC